MTMSRTTTATGPPLLGAARQMRRTRSGKHLLKKEKRGGLWCRSLRLRKLVTPLVTLEMNWTGIILNTCTGEQGQCVAFTSVLAFK